MNRSLHAVAAQQVDCQVSATAAGSSVLPPVTLSKYHKRTIKCFDKRGRRDKWITTPIQQIEYQNQLYFTHPGGFHAQPRTTLTHYDKRERVYVRNNKDDPGLHPDWENWGREIGQANQPQRHQRVAFDHNDALHPSKVQKSTTPKQKKDDVFGQRFHTSKDFDPKEEVYNSSIHKNNHETIGRPTDYRVLRPRGVTKPGDRLLQVWGDNHEFNKSADMVPLGNLTANHREEWNWLFKENIRPEMRFGLVDGRRPGVNAPFTGEQDTHMMLAMSMPLRATEDTPGTAYTGLGDEIGADGKPHTYADAMLSDNTRDFNSVTINQGYGSKILYINRPNVDNELDLHTLEYLVFGLNQADAGMLTKAVLLKGAQVGETDFFSAGVSLTSLANLMRSAAELEDPQSRLQALTHADATLRAATNLLWKVFTMKRPLIVNSNGRCQNIANGLALLSKYSAVQKNTEFNQQGPECGMTPFGGLTHFLARKETELKYPGLAEFIMLTGSPLYAGDALKLGWTDLYTSVPGCDFHTKKWFEDSADYIHNDAVAYQLGMLLDDVFRYKGPAAGDAEPPRSYLTPTKAKWIEDAFADQPDVQSVIDTLSQIEKIPLEGPGSEHNTTEPISYPTSLQSVQEGLDLLDSQSLRFTVQPWEVSKVKPATRQNAEGEEEEEELYDSHPHQTLREYQFNGSKLPVGHAQDAAVQQWKQHRAKEFNDYQTLRNVKMNRHIFARVEGSEGTMVDFEFEFDASKSTTSLLDATVVNNLAKQVNAKLGYPADRPVELAWYLPSADTAPIRTDLELHEVMLADPGIMSSKQPTQHPPLYLVVNRQTQYFSEWAYVMNHQLNLVSPTALCASLKLLQAVRDLPEAGAIESTLNLEMRVASKMIQNKEFYQVGMAGKTLNANKAAAQLETGKIVVNGHTYNSRPKWEPRTVSEVNATDIEELITEPIKFNPQYDNTDNKESQAGKPASGHLTDFHVSTQADKMDKILNTMLAMEVPVEKVAGLGERDADTGSKKTANMKSDVTVPHVDFYNMNRHPWLEHKSSWRQHGFTKGSQEYFQRKYEDAVQQALVKPTDGSTQYWPTSEYTSVSPLEEEEQRLVQERIWAPIELAKNEIAPPLQELRKNAEALDFSNYKLDPLNNEEKQADDHFYRWFHANPGVSPNPSGILRFGSMAKTVELTEAESVASKSKEAWVTEFEDETEMDPIEAARAAAAAAEGGAESSDGAADDGMTAEE